MAERFEIDRIVEGDCREVLMGLPDNSVDCVFADPPYNLQLGSGLARPDGNSVSGVDDDWDRFEDYPAYDAFSRAWLEGVRREMKDDATIWVIGSYHNIFRIGALMMDLGFWILNDVQWIKTNPMPNFKGRRFQNATETMIWAKKSRDQKRYVFDYHAMKNLNGEVQMRNTWDLPICGGEERLRRDGRKVHSTQKPEALLYRVILASTVPGGIVLDPFLGTGTTAAVAKRLGRHYIGIERDPEYLNAARKRLSETPWNAADEKWLQAGSPRRGRQVSVAALLEESWLVPGEVLRSSRGEVTACLRVDGMVEMNGFVGSIHKAGAEARKSAACNGWDFWCVKRDGAWVPLDALREWRRRGFLEKRRAA